MYEFPRISAAGDSAGALAWLKKWAFGFFGGVGAYEWLEWGDGLMEPTLPCGGGPNEADGLLGGVLWVRT